MLGRATPAARPRVGVKTAAKSGALSCVFPFLSCLANLLSTVFFSSRLSVKTHKHAFFMFVLSPTVFFLQVFFFVSIRQALSRSRIEYPPPFPRPAPVTSTTEPPESHTRHPSTYRRPYALLRCLQSSLRNGPPVKLPALILRLLGNQWSGRRTRHSPRTRQRRWSPARPAHAGEWRRGRQPSRSPGHTGERWRHRGTAA